MAQRRLAAQAFTLLNAHIVVVAILLIFDLVLATRLAVAWHDSHSDQSAQYNADLATYAQLQAQSKRLESLPARLAESRTHAGEFIQDRMPLSDSAWLAELGALTSRNHVRLSRAVYVPRPAIPGLVEQRIDANVAGEYPAIMHFINDVERDKNHNFFIIRSIVLSGQQGGLVNLRVIMTTFQRVDPAAAVAMSTSGNGGAGSGEEQ